MDLKEELKQSVSFTDIQNDSLCGISIDEIADRLEYSWEQISNADYPTDFEIVDYADVIKGTYVSYMMHSETKLVIAFRSAKKSINLSNENEDVYEMVAVTAESVRGKGISTHLIQNLISMMRVCDISSSKSFPARKRKILMAELLPQFRDISEKILLHVGMSKSTRFREDNPVFEMVLDEEQ